MATLEEIRTERQALRRFQIGMFGGFAAIALVLGFVGVAGSVAESVARTTREIGIRMALGASRGGVLRHFILRMMRVVSAGSLLGIGLALLVGPLVSRLLYEVDPRDPASLAVAAGVLLAGGLFASALPAVAALRVDPAVALRSDA